MIYLCQFDEFSFLWRVYSQHIGGLFLGGECGRQQDVSAHIERAQVHEHGAGCCIIGQSDLLHRLKDDNNCISIREICTNFPNSLTYYLIIEVREKSHRNALA